MMFPPSTNDQYGGFTISAWFLALLGLLSIVPGGIHYFLPDGGAGVIAHLDMGDRAPVIIGVFAWMGATQLAYGLAQLAVALRYRALVPFFLTLSLLERSLHALAAWIFKAPPGAHHHPPENYGVLVALPLIALFLVLSLVPRKR
ncbi:MAG: hypothetical protein QM759_06790 [Terricaulis sp.]